MDLVVQYVTKSLKLDVVSYICWTKCSWIRGNNDVPHGVSVEQSVGWLRGINDVPHGTSVGHFAGAIGGAIYIPYGASVGYFAGAIDGNNDSPYATSVDGNVGSTGSKKKKKNNTRDQYYKIAESPKRQTTNM